MGNSFQDQFLKLGLVKKDQVSKLKKKQYKKKKAKENNQEAEQARKAGETRQKKQKDYTRLLNEQKARQKKENELSNRIRQIIERNHLEEIAGDIVYKFTDQGKIRKLFTTDEIAHQLSKGIVGIVKNETKKRTDYHIVPANSAKKIEEIAPQFLCLLHIKKTEIDEEDPYAEYEIPDDLMW